MASRKQGSGWRSWRPVERTHRTWELAGRTWNRRKSGLGFWHQSGSGGPSVRFGLLLSVQRNLLRLRAGTEETATTTFGYTFVGCAEPLQLVIRLIGASLQESPDVDSHIPYSREILLNTKGAHAMRELRGGSHCSDVSRETSIPVVRRRFECFT